MGYFDDLKENCILQGMNINDVAVLGQGASLTADGKYVLSTSRKGNYKYVIQYCKDEDAYFAREYNGKTKYTVNRKKFESLVGVICEESMGTGFPYKQTETIILFRKNGIEEFVDKYLK